MTPSRRKITLAGILLFTSVVLLYLSLYLLVQSSRFRTWIQAELAQRTGYEIKVGSLKLSPPIRLVASAVLVSNPTGVTFHGDRVILTFTPLDLFAKRIHRLTLERPVLRIDLKNLFAPSGGLPLNFSIRSLNIKDGELVLETESRESLPIRSIDLKADNLNLEGKDGAAIRAYLPWLDGDADLQILGTTQAREAEIRIRQRPSKSFAGLLRQKEEATGSLKANLKLKELTDKRFELAASGEVHKFNVGNEKITGDFNSHLTVAAGFKAMDALLQLRLAQSPSRIGSMELPLSEGPITATIEGHYSFPEKVFDVREIKLVSSLGSAEGKGKISMSGSTAILNTALRVRDISLNALNQFLPKPLGRLDLKGTAAADLHLSGPFNSLAINGVVHSQETKIQGEKFHLSRLSVRAPFEFANSSFRAKGARVEAKGIAWGRKEELQLEAEEMSFAGDVEKKWDGPFRSEGQFQIVQGRFSTPDGSKVGEQLTMSGNFSLANGVEGNRIPFKGKAEIAGLELLWGKFFADFRDEKPVIEIDGTYASDKDEVKLERMNVMLRSIGGVELKGAIQRLSNDPAFNLDVTAPNLFPGGFYSFFIRDTFKKSYPLLGRLRIGGKSSLAFHIQGSLKEFASEGSLKLQASEIREESDKWRIGPIQMALPFRFHYPRAVQQEATEKPQMASLLVQEAKLGSTPIPTVRMAFGFWNNSLHFAEPIHIPLYGGSIVIKDLAWKDVVGAPKNLSFSLEVNDISMLEMTEALGWHRFGGKLSGSIPQFQFVGNSLHSRGEVKLEVFDGRVLVKGLEIQEPFSSLPSIKMDLWLEEINLERVSETFEFGRISGILQGAIEELVVTQGQAAQFKAELHTVERQDVSQWISVEALDKITVLSSGDEAGSIYGGFTKLFDFFRYSKLGFKATLRNDRLVLRGIESREGQEYLVVGTFLPPTVNIVSHTQIISFSELMRRLERVRQVGRAEPSIKKEGP